jgi:Amt family ammonium transporter
VANLDGVSNIEGGWLDHNYKQLYKQFAYVCATCAYNFVVTALICKALDLIPGLSLRASAEAEEIGMDDDQVSAIHVYESKLSLTDTNQIGEFASDYVELRRNYWDAPQVSDEQISKLDAPLVSNGNHNYAAGDRHGKPDHEIHTQKPASSEMANENEKASEITPSDVS